jgi:hypothetical protein
MRFIPTLVHGVLDYVVGVLLIIAPSLLGFAQSGAESWVPMALGMAVLVYSCRTTNECGLSCNEALPLE